VKWLRLAKTPPSYVIERISDLMRVIKESHISPRSAKSLLEKIVKQLQDHMDVEYLDDLQMAQDVMLDSPVRGSDIILLVVERMKADKLNSERRKPHGKRTGRN
jgi:hypothetical protein